MENARKTIEYFVVNKDMDGFLADIIQFNYRADNGINQYALTTDFILQTWKSWDAFKTFIYSLKRESPALIEFKEFYGKFEKANHASYLGFDFKVILVKTSE